MVSVVGFEHGGGVDDDDDGVSAVRHACVVCFAAAPLRCGTCGGDRCKGNGDCCEHTIQEQAEMCSDTNMAPCIIISNKSE